MTQSLESVIKRLNVLEGIDYQKNDENLMEKRNGKIYREDAVQEQEGRS